MPLRIGICAPYDLARDGGVNSHIRAQASALRQLGHAVRVFGAASGRVPDGEVAVSGCVRLVIGGTDTPIGIDPRAWRRVGRLFAAERFDLVHVHEPLMPLVPWCALLRGAVPVVATFHTYREGAHRFYPRARAWLAPLMDRVTVRLAVSSAARQTIADSFPGAYTVVPNGIDTARFAVRTPRPPEYRDGVPHLLCVGRLEPRKGVEHLIDAVAHLRDMNPAPRLVIAGEGPDAAALRARAQQAGVDAWFAGRVDEAQLVACYQHADVVCAPAVGGESFGIVLLEAMAAGRAIVAADIDGYRELAGESGAAEFVPPGDAAALARALRALLPDTSRRERLGDAGRAFVRAFDWRCIARRLDAIYRDALRSSSDGFQTRSCSTK